jgi:hypothetical protein
MVTKALVCQGEKIEAPANFTRAQDNVAQIQFRLVCVAKQKMKSRRFAIPENRSNSADKAPHPGEA